MQVVVKKGSGWYYFQNPSKIWKACTLHDVLPMLQEAERWAQNEGEIIAGYLTYEAASAFDSAMPEQQPDTPIFVLGAFKTPVYKQEFRVHPANSTFESITYVFKWKEGVSRQKYEAGFREIRERIKNGDSYQVNFTWPLLAPLKGSPTQRDAQMRQLAMSLNGVAAPQAAWVAWEDVRIASASPELFFSRNGEDILMRPMKGTAERKTDEKEDALAGERLIQSPKERAENLMITDMIRNDLSRICHAETVKVPHLFTVEKYPTVWQMTSTITGKLRDEHPTLADILSALFPCASITGAPKISAMNIIQSTEPHPRGVYTGAIGFWDPTRSEAEFSVAIRTAVGNVKTGELCYGTGSGVVWDSESDKEWAECHQKTKVLTQAPAYWKLLETMLILPNAHQTDWNFPFLCDSVPVHQGVVLGEYHWARLRKTADELGFQYSDEILKKEVAAKMEGITQPQKVRVLVGMGGAIFVEAEAVESSKKMEVELARAPIDSSDWRLKFKTTNRAPYNAFMSEADDVLLWNERGEITETRIGNVMYRMDGEPGWFTPSLSSGLLNGTLRNWLLEKGFINERILRKSDLPKVGDIWRINSVRGCQKMVVHAKN